MPEAFNQSVYEIFGGLKKRWPTLTTMAVLNWQTFPSDLPLDVSSSPCLSVSLSLCLSVSLSLPIFLSPALPLPVRV
jgi:hypothetical protein